MHRGQDEQRSGGAAAEGSKQGGAPLPSPNIDPELVPLPFLVFSGGLLRSANEGARTLLGLEDGLLKRRGSGSGSGSAGSGGDGEGSGESDEGTVVMLVDASEDAGPSGGRYSYEDLFPPAIDVVDSGGAAASNAGIGLGLSPITAAGEEGASSAIGTDGEQRRTPAAGHAAGASSAAPSSSSDPYGSSSSSGVTSGQGAPSRTKMPAAPRRSSTSIAINRLDTRRHLQSLRACVQSSGELIKCKAAVHTNENSERESWIRSILIVDVSPEVSPASSPPSSSLSPLERARQRQQSAGSGPSPDPLLTGSGSPPTRSATVGKGHRQRQASAPPASTFGRQHVSAVDSTPYSATSPHHPHPSRPSLPNAIKRHSGDIRKIFANTIERKWNQMSQSQTAAPVAQTHAGPSASTSSTTTDDASASNHPVRPSVSPIPTNSHNDAGRSNSTNSESTASTRSTIPGSEASTMATSAGSVGPGSSGTGKHAPGEADETSVAGRGLSPKTSTSGPSGIAATAPTMSISYSETPSNPSFRGPLHRKRASITSMDPNISPPVSPKGSPHPLPTSSVAGAMHFSDNLSSSTSLAAGRMPGLPTRHSNSDGSSGASSHQTRASRLARTFAAETSDFSLAQSALAAHPRTGVIISKLDLSSGFINSRTRELLMGIKSPENEHSTDPFDDMWYSAAAAKERRPPPEASLFEDDAQSIESATEQPGQSPVWEDDIVFQDGKVRIDLPDRGQNLETSISDILRWSLRRRRIRQHHRVLRDETASNMSTRSGISGSGSGGHGGGGSGGPYGSAFSPSGSVSGLAFSSLPRSSMAMTAGDAATILQGLKDDDASRPWIAHKPYKVFDPAFSQRIEDPFEALFDQCVRKGVSPPGGDNSIIVGIETQVGPAETCGFPDSECFTYSSETVDGAPGSGLVQIRVRRRVVQARAAPLRDVNGDHVGGVVWLRDITGESGDPKSNAHVSVPKEAGTGLDGPGGNNAVAGDSSVAAIPGFQGPTGLDASAFWQQIINSMPQMVWVTKPDGSHIYFNNKWYSYTGLQPEQSLGVNWQNPFHPDDMPGTRRAWSRSLATGEPYSVEYRCRRHDGVWRWQLGRAQAMFDANGTIIAWFGTLTDIEEGMQLRTQLAETTRNLRRVIDLANVTLLCVDRDLKLLFMDGGRHLLSVVAGPDERSLIGAELSSILPDPAFTRKAQQVLDGLESARVEFEIRPDNWIGCHLTPLREKAGEPPHGVVVVCTEITDLKEAEKALKKSSEEQARLLASETAAKEASRLKSEFTANLSHEIRTPITGMIGMSELLLEEEMSPGQHDSVRKILRSGEILLKMVGDVLDIGKVEAGKLELDIQPFALQDLVTDATTMFRTAATKKGLRFNEETSNLYRGEVLGDLPRMRQVLLNFLANSVKFTKQGFITLKVRQDQETESDIIVRFVVEDSGIGIAKNVMPILFQAFQQADSTTSREHGGTGLGLAISKRLVELMDGTVKLESDLGKGTKITVLVPFQKSTNPPSRRPSTRSRNSGSSGSSSATAGRQSLEAGDRSSSTSSSELAIASTPERSSASSAGNQQKISPPKPYTNQGTADRAHAGTQSQARVQFAPSSPPPADRSSLTARSASSAANTADAASRASVDLDRSSIWILLAEDNALNSEIFTRGITRMGFNVRAVVNGEEALRAMHEREWDLVLLDGQMPVMDGYEAARRIRLDPDPKISQVTVIALTASAISGDREKCLAAGMTDYLAKPVRLKVLEETLVSYLKRGQAAKRPQADRGDRPAAGTAPQRVPPPIQSNSSFDARSFP